VGSRLGTHIYWTVALSAAITLLAVSPLLLPGGTRTNALPPPLAGLEKVGEVVASALAPPASAETGDEQAPGTTTPPPPAAAATTPGMTIPATPATPEFGVLSGLAGGSTSPTAETDSRSTKRAQPRSRLAGDRRPQARPERETTKAEARAQAKQSRAEAKAARKDVHSAAKVERNEARQATKAASKPARSKPARSKPARSAPAAGKKPKAHGPRVGSPAAHGKKHGHSQGKGGKKRS
jgi:hypothetical protein